MGTQDDEIKGSEDQSSEIDSEESESTSQDKGSDQKKGSGHNRPPKRGKYKIFDDKQKMEIIAFVHTHGISEAIKKFSDNENRLTRRKIKSWIDSLNKIKGIKGRKSSDKNRDHNLFKWCQKFF